MSNVSAEHAIGSEIRFDSTQSPEYLPAGEYVGQVLGQSSVLRGNGMDVTWLKVRIMEGDLKDRTVTIAVRKDENVGNNEAEKLAVA